MYIRTWYLRAVIAIQHRPIYVLHLDMVGCLLSHRLANSSVPRVSRTNDFVELAIAMMATQAQTNYLNKHCSLFISFFKVFVYFERLT